MNQKKSQYEFIVEMPKGNYGKVIIILDQVYLCKKQESPELFQIEQIINDSLTELSRKQLEMELFLLQNIKHKNFLTFIDHFVEEGCQYLVQSFHNALSLKEYQEKNTKIPERVAQTILKQILQSLQELQRYQIIYCPLKLGDILLLDGNIIKLINLGGCLKQDDPIPKINDSIVPEIIESKNILFETNIFCVGFIFHQILYGVPPFKLTSRSAMQIQLYLSSIRNQNLNFISDQQISEYSKKLLTEMLMYSPQQRITVQKALEILNNLISESGQLKTLALDLSQIQTTEEIESLVIEQSKETESFNIENSYDLQVIIDNYEKQQNQQSPILLQKYNKIRDVIQFYVNTAVEMNQAQQLYLHHIQFLLFNKAYLELKKLEQELKLNDIADYKEFQSMVEEMLPIIDYQISEIRERMKYWSVYQLAIVSETTNIETIHKKLFESITTDFQLQKIQKFFRVHNHIIDCFMLREFNVNQMPDNWQNDFDEKKVLICVDKQEIIKRIANIKI